MEDCVALGSDWPKPKWYEWYRLPLKPSFRYRPANEQNTASYYFSWLVFRAWTSDSIMLGFSWELDDQQLNIRLNLPYLWTGLFIPVFPEKFHQKLWRKSKWMRSLSAIAFALFLASCATIPPEVKQETPVQEAPQNQDDHTTTPQKPCVTSPKTWCYVQQTKDALQKYGTALLAASPSDYKLYCGTAPKLDCYDAILHAMSVYESGIDPNQVYTESFADAKGNKVKSVGLLQVSIESCRSYGSLATSTEELMGIEKNLECGVRILNRWVVADGVIAGGSKGAWRGGSRYWAVLRDKQASIREKARGYLK